MQDESDLDDLDGIQDPTGPSPDDALDFQVQYLKLQLERALQKP